MDQDEEDFIEDQDRQHIYQEKAKDFAKQDVNLKQKNANSEQHGESIVGGGGFPSKFIDYDVRLTSDFAVCATKDSPLGGLRPVMKILEISCHGIPWLAVTIFLMFKNNDVQSHEILVNLLAALILDLIISGILKASVRRKRPQHNKSDMFFTVSVDHYSFPSGHTSRAAMTAYFMYEILGLTLSFNVLIWMWAVAVSISRVMLGRHHISDVATGFIVGLIQYLIIAAYWIPAQTCHKYVLKAQGILW